MKKKCLYCNESLKKFSSSKDEKNRLCHRGCWLKNRKFTHRYADHLFGASKKMTNTIHHIKPTIDASGN